MAGSDVTGSEVTGSVGSELTTSLVIGASVSDVSESSSPMTSVAMYTRPKTATRPPTTIAAMRMLRWREACLQLLLLALRPVGLLTFTFLGSHRSRRLPVRLRDPDRAGHAPALS